MKLQDLRFDNPNNSCESLRVLAELARQGEITVRAATPTETDGDTVMRMTAIQRGKRR